MELDEFATIWHASLKNEMKEGQTASAQKINIPMKTINTLDLIQQSNSRWLKKALNQLPYALVLFVVYLVLYLTLPETERLDGFKNGVIVFLTLLVFGALKVTVAYVQYQLFNIKPHENIKSALQRAVKRFNYLFRYVFLVSVPVCLLVGVVITRYLSGAFHLRLPGGLILLISLAITAITVALTYRYYQRTYFPWISQLKKSLDELTEA